jgi:hypothetical protein
VFLPRFVLYAFKSDADRDYSEAVSLRLLWTLIDINMMWLSEHPETPTLMRSGLRYNGQAYQLGQEDWMDVPSALLTCRSCETPRAEGAPLLSSPPLSSPSVSGVGTDCKVLVAYLIAELRMHGIDARPWLLRQARLRMPDGSISYGYHVVVRMPNGVLVDISKILGMTPSTVS